MLHIHWCESVHSFARRPLRCQIALNAPKATVKAISLRLVQTPTVDQSPRPRARKIRTLLAWLPQFLLERLDVLQLLQGMLAKLRQTFNVVSGAATVISRVLASPSILVAHLHAIPLDLVATVTRVALVREEFSESLSP
jgi:hypothetical protein